MKSFKTTLTLLFLSYSSFAQFTTNSSENPPAFRELKVSVKNGNNAILFGQQATSFVIKNLSSNVLNNLQIVENEQIIALKIDEHSDTQGSNLVVFEKPLNQIEILSNGFEGEIIAHVFYAKPLIINANAKMTGDCDKPTFVAGTTWRVGLAAPKEAPSGTQVKHIIVHHAAGSNTATNYTDVVRNIYLFHTQSNGWNDVGYNFLIAQDGTVYEGRLGNSSIENDNVLGAHFCSKNANTMGICLLGDYMLVNPPTAALKSLNILISWKLRKENMKAIGSAPHPTTTSSALNFISGHRDGCSTDCPGDNVYKILDQIRQDIPNVCGGSVVSSIPNFGEELKIYPQPSTNTFVVEASGEELKNVMISNAKGQVFELSPIIKDAESAVFDASKLGRGVYILKVGSKAKKIILN